MLKKSVCIVAICLLTLGVWANQTESETNDTRGTADGAISFNETLLGGLPGSYMGDSSYPQDYWQFSATAGYSYKFTALPQNCSIYVSPLDLALDIEDSVGGFVVSQDTGGDCVQEVLNWVCPSSGTYYLIVWEATSTPQAISWYYVVCEESTSVDDWELY